MDFNKMIGLEVPFYGVCDNCFKVGKSVFEAIEDESDGYRSYLESVEVKDPKGLIFFRTSIAKVKIVEVDEFNGHGLHAFTGYLFVDTKDGHCWLAVGTNYMDDYYPCFTVTYTPKKEQ